MKNAICVAVVQLTAKQDVTQNLDQAESLVRKAAARGAQLVLLPENFTYVGILGHEVSILEPLFASGETPQGPILARMHALAKSLNIHLLLGGIPTKAPSAQQCYNTAILLGPDGEILSHYHKVHLFDINIPDGAVSEESQYVAAGENIVTTDLLGTTLGFSICYDLRFPELYRELSSRGAEIAVVPAAFTLHTGKDHWFPLLRARAIENEMYILAAGQGGRHTEARVTYGKSCIIDPWGTVIAQVSDGDGIAVAELDPERLSTIRTQLPCLSHRRMPLSKESNA